MNERGLSVLASPFFLFGLCLLLLNDFVLKEQFHNPLTGKLSDFAGLFVFTLFWTAFAPRRRLAVHLLSALAFIYWKSAYSQSLIDGWNDLQLFQLSRTVDYGDLIALIVIPMSYLYGLWERKNYPPRIALCAIAFVSLAAFTATSYNHDTDYNNEYTFQIPRAALIKQIKGLRKKYDNYHLSEAEADKYEIDFDSCISSATIEVGERNGLGVIKLVRINFRCPSGGDRQQMLQFFEKEFIEKLKEGNPEGETQIINIYPLSSSANDNRAKPSPKLKDTRQPNSNLPARHPRFPG